MPSAEYYDYKLPDKHTSFFPIQPHWQNGFVEQATDPPIKSFNHAVGLRTARWESNDAQCLAVCILGQKHNGLWAIFLSW